MPTYRFRCTSCGDFEKSISLHVDSSSSSCPECEESSHKVFAPLGLSRAQTGAMRITDSTKATAHQPNVVTNIPGRARSRPRADPRTAKLPTQ